MSDVNFDLGLAIGEFKKAAAEATAATQQLSNDFKQATGQMQKNFDSSAKNMGSSWNVFVGTLSVDVFKKAISSLVGVFETAIEEASQAEESVNNLNVALRQSGQYSSESSKDLQEFAASLQKTTIYSDDAVLSTLSMIESLTDLDKNTLKSVTKATVDFAAKYGKSLDEAATMVARGIEGNTVAFSKMGIKIKDGATQVERLQNVMQALAGSQGAAEAKANTFAGSMAKLKNQIGESYENLGKWITGNETVIGAINLAASGFESLATSIAKTGKFIADNKDYFIALGIGIGTVSAAFGIYVVAVNGAAAATAAYNALLAVNPIYWVAAGVAALISGIALLIIKWDQVKLATLGFVQATLEAMIPLQTAFNKMFGMDTKGFTAALESVKNKIKETKDAINQKNNPIIDNKETEEAKKEAEEQARIAKEKAAKRLETERKSQAELAIVRKEAADLEKNSDAELKNSLANEDTKFQEAKRLREIESMKITQAEKDALIIADIEKRNAERIAELEAVQFQEDEKLRITTEAELAKAKLIEDTTARNKAIAEANSKAELAKKQLDNKQALDMVKLKNDNTNKLEQKRVDSQKQIDAEMVANRALTLNTIATMQSANNKTLAMIGKAAAGVQLGIDAIAGVSKAWALGPIIGPPAAALVATAFAVQGAKLAGLQFADGGIVPGSSFVGDKVPANVNSGEMILNKQQQAQLFAQANGEYSSSGLLDAINNLGNRISNMEIKLFTTDSAIALATSRGVMDGVVLGASR